MDKREALEKTKELAKVNPVAEMEEDPQEEAKKVEKTEEIEEEEKEYDEIKHNRLMMEFDAHDIDETSDKTINEKKKNGILLLVLVVGILSICILFILYINNTDKAYDYKEETKNSLNVLYTSNEDKELNDLLTHIKDNEDQIKYVNEESYKTANGWIDYLVSKKYNDYEEFSKGCNTIRDIIEKLYSAEVSSTKALKESDYNSLKDKLNKVDAEGKEYYQAYEKYTAKEYNESYHLFSVIKEDSGFYKSSQEYLVNIISEVMDNIQKEVDNIQIITVQDKNDIVKKLYEYIEVYNYLDLGNNATYQAMIQAYKE